MFWSKSVLFRRWNVGNCCWKVVHVVCFRCVEMEEESFIVWKCVLYWVLCPFLGFYVVNGWYLSNNCFGAKYVLESSGRCVCVFELLLKWKSKMLRCQWEWKSVIVCEAGAAAEARDSFRWIDDKGGKWLAWSVGFQWKQVRCLILCMSFDY